MKAFSTNSIFHGRQSDGSRESWTRTLGGEGQRVSKLYFSRRNFFQEKRGRETRRFPHNARQKQHGGILDCREDMVEERDTLDPAFKFKTRTEIARLQLSIRFKSLGRNRISFRASPLHDSFPDTSFRSVCQSLNHCNLNCISIHVV